jgi:AcrR family transcriptional regulator
MDDSLAHWPAGVARAWGLVPVGRRGPRGRYSLDDVVAAAVAAADEGGLRAVSLPRLADRLGVTPTALYRYVASKDELVALMADAGVGDPPSLDPAAGWRECARTWTEAVVARLRQRPWLLDVRLRAPITPGSLRWFEAFLSATRPLPLHAEERVQCATLLDGHARAVAALGRDLSAEAPAYPPDVVEALVPRLLAGGYPEVAALLAQVAQAAPAPAVQGLTAVSDFGLDRILDGIDALVRARTGSAP